MNDKKVDEFENKAHELEKELEKLGQMICDVPNSCTSWHHVNEAIAELQTAINDAYLMRSPE